MASPTFTSGSVGGSLSAVTLLASKNKAVYYDFTGKIEGHVTARVTTGSSVTSNTFTKNEGYYVYASTSINNGAGYASGTTSIVVTSATGIGVGQKIVVKDELRTVSAVSSNTLTVDALTYAKVDGDPVYLVEREPTFPGVSALGGAINTTYSKTMYLPTGRWCFVLSNTDSSNAVTIEITSSTIDSFV